MPGLAPGILFLASAVVDGYEVGEEPVPFIPFGRVLG